jgi:hypothetical protein
MGPARGAGHHRRHGLGQCRLVGVGAPAGNGALARCRPTKWVTREPEFWRQRLSRRAPPQMQVKRKRSPSRVVHSSVEVKFWAEHLPTVDQVRPAHCPYCGRSSRPVGGGLVLVGHGTRERQVRGPLTPGTSTLHTIIQVRRYRCRGCGAVVTVLPRGVVACRHFGAGAIGLALHAWALEKRPLNSVRESMGGRDEEHRGWPTARRWVDAIQAGRMFGSHVRPCPQGWRRVRIAERAATTLMGLGRPVANSVDSGVQVFVGAALAA